MMKATTIRSSMVKPMGYVPIATNQALISPMMRPFSQSFELKIHKNDRATELDCL